MSVLTMAQAARAVGLSYDRFRKQWSDLPGFPPPFRARCWSAQAVADWIDARSRPPGEAPPGPPSRPADIPRQRRSLAQLRMAG